MSERHGIEIDYCPQCRGVWLDRGELDKIIERAAPAPAAVTRSAPPAPSYGQVQQGSPQQSYPQGHHGGHYHKKKREGFLSELFDFD
jgi:hypothetical protein